jgi:predicted site-specific integrase-resolvase
VAIIIGISRKLVNRWIHDGQLPAFRMGHIKRKADYYRMPGGLGELLPMH